VVRIWTHGQGRLRGVIEHTATREQLAFLDPTAILAFIRAHSVVPPDLPMMDRDSPGEPNDLNDTHSGTG